VKAGDSMVWLFVVILCARACSQSSDIDRLERKVRDLQIEVGARR
jgi:hypothetical protein